MSIDEDLLSRYQGQIVLRSFRAGFVILSYVVSCIGATLTFELLNRRTSRNGLFNHIMLVTAAVAMGGVSIWSMHFVGNHAIILGNGEPELRINFSNGASALSFLLPVIVLLLAFVAIGANYTVSRWRIILGGVLAGAGVCGMHYLGNASINNYHCVYDNAYVIGAAFIAVFDSILALSLFFVFRASWTNSWWKRVLSAFLLAGAVSGMHWVAAIGTNYRLKHLNESSQNSQIHALILVVCIAVLAALFIAGSIIYAMWIMRHNARKVQKVVLATAVFDTSGRILVNPDGLLPSEKITDAYVEQAQGDIFSVAHPLFHWMFQVSRDWNSVSGMVGRMTKHLARLPKGIRDSKARLVDDDGQPIENYETIFRESFCVAAANLAAKLKEQLVDVGVLWDEILTAGTDGASQKSDRNIDQILEKGTYGKSDEGGKTRFLRSQEHGRGILMFLVRRLEHPHEVNRLEAAGFRFAEIHQVCGIIGSRMQVKSRDFNGKLANMATFARGNMIMEPGVHLGFFGVKARVGSFGFDIITKRGARNLLPNMPIHLERLEPWQMDVIRKFERTNVPLLLQGLGALKKLSPREMIFASRLSDALNGLRAWIDDPIFDEAVLTSKVVQVPCRTQKSCTMIVLCMMMPIHTTFSSPRCEFAPLNFFKVHQMSYKNSSQLAAFTRHVHRELSPIVSTPSIKQPQAAYQRVGRVISWSRLRSLGRAGRPNSHVYSVVDGDEIQAKSTRKSSNRNSVYSDSTKKFWNQNPRDSKMSHNDMMSDEEVTHEPLSLGGIMVSQEIQVDIRQIDDVGGGSSALLKPAAKTDRVTMVKAGMGFDFEMEGLPETDMLTGQPFGSAIVEHEKTNSEVITFVDELFTICVDAL